MPEHLSRDTSALVPRNDWERIRLLLATFTAEVDMPSDFARNLLDEIMLLARVNCGEEIE